MLKLISKSANGKTGPIATTYRAGAYNYLATCPLNCPLRANGCYADNGHCGLAWRKTSRRAPAANDPAALLDFVKSLPAGSLLRHHVAGDIHRDLSLIPKGRYKAPAAKRKAPAASVIDKPYLKALRKAVPAAGIAWTYTHSLQYLYKERPPLDGETVINISAADDQQAVDAIARGHPVTIIQAVNKGVKALSDGTRVITCPALLGDAQCINCGNGKPLCARRDRDYVIAFTVHGSGAKKALATIA